MQNVRTVRVLAWFVLVLSVAASWIARTRSNRRISWARPMTLDGAERLRQRAACSRRARDRTGMPTRTAS